MFKKLIITVLPFCSAFTLATSANAATYTFSIGEFIDISGGPFRGAVSGDFSGTDTSGDGWLSRLELTDFNAVFTHTLGTQSFDRTSLFEFEIPLFALPPSTAPGYGISMSGGGSGIIIESLLENANGVENQALLQTPTTLIDARTLEPLFVTEVSAVPVPAAMWLFGSGLICLIGLARSKAA